MKRQIKMFRHSNDQIMRINTWVHSFMNQKNRLNKIIFFSFDTSNIESKKTVNFGWKDHVYSLHVYFFLDCSMLLYVSENWQLQDIFSIYTWLLLLLLTGVRNNFTINPKLSYFRLLLQNTDHSHAIALNFPIGKSFCFCNLKSSQIQKCVEF